MFACLLRFRERASRAWRTPAMKRTFTVTYTEHVTTTATFTADFPLDSDGCPDYESWFERMDQDPGRVVETIAVTERWVESMEEVKSKNTSDLDNPPVTA